MALCSCKLQEFLYNRSGEPDTHISNFKKIIKKKRIISTCFHIKISNSTSLKISENKLQ